jgi:predicted enzyme related to lactoylglutathione lyase
MTAPTTGRFVWHELHTSDRQKAVKFYTQLMGWKSKDVPMGQGEPYSLALVDGQDVAGITKSMAGPGVPPHWLAYLAVDDVDASAKKATELGGKIMSPPMDIPNVGRFAVVLDPTGAAFALHKHATPYPDEPPFGGVFCWEELATSDPEAAVKFYTGLFGYTIEQVDMGPMGTYTLLKRGDRQTAGVTKLPPGVPHSTWLTYLAVKNVDESTRNARELGAKVMMEPTDIPNIGRFSVIVDPTGAGVALFTGIPPQK